MVKKMVKYAWCLLFVALLMPLSACSGNSEVKTETNDIPRIVFVTPLNEHAVWDIAKKGFEDAANDLNFGADYVGPKELDPEAMVDLMNKAIYSKVDGIITMAVDNNVLNPVMEKAAEGGIAVAFVAADAPSSSRLFFIGTDQKKIGEIGGSALLSRMNGKPIRAVIMQSTMVNSFANNARESYLEVLKNYPDFKLIANVDCDSDIMVAIQRFEYLFDKYPEINTVIGVCGEAGPAAARVVKELGIQDKVNILAIDDVDETLNLVRDGSIWGTVAQNYYKMGYDAAKSIYYYVRDGEMPENKVFDSGCMLVTEDNVDTYKSSWYSVD